VLVTQQIRKLAWVIKDVSIYQCYIPAGESLCDPGSWWVCSLACCAATANTCMVSAGHSAIRKQQSLPVSKECDTSVLYTMLSHLCDLVPSGAVCIRVLRCNSDLHGECWSQQSGATTSLPGSSKECYTSVLYTCCLSHLCDIVPGAVCSLTCAATANTCMVSAGH
jgi:hypothetical protein